MTNDTPTPEQLEPAAEAAMREARRNRHPLEDPRTTAPATMRGMTPREAARLGNWSDGHPGIKRKYPYSITE
jgi:hypothetical protein